MAEPLNRQFVLANFSLPIFPTDSVKKDAHVETLRGLAIILVVLGHMIGQSHTGGMRVSDDSFLRYLYYSLEYVRLPLFTVISGWVYANKPAALGDRGKFLSGKLRRLLVPMFVISTMLFLFRMIVPGTNTTPALVDLPRNLIFPYDVYWYLFSLFLIFVVITFIDARLFFQRPGGWLIVVAASLLFLFISENFLDPIPNFFSFKGAAYLFPYFLLGIGIYRFPQHLLRKRTVLIAFFLFLAGIAVQQGIWFSNTPHQEKHSLLGMTVGFTASLLLFKIPMKNALLVFIGSFAYTIFLFHVFFTGGSRIVLLRLGIDHQAIILIAGVVMAIAFPVILDLLIRRIPVLRFYLLGLRKTPKPGIERAS